MLVAQGALDSAFSLARVLWDQSAGVRYVVGHRQRAVLAVRLAMANGEVDFARDVTQTLEVGAARTPAASAIAAALRCRGLLERRPEMLIEAAHHLRATARRLELAVCCEDVAAIFGEADRRDEAIATLHEAVAVYDELGATGDVARVDESLRSLGAPRSRRPAPRPAFGWEALTPTELNVAHLTAQGLTNPLIGQRLFISRRTVEAHLSSIYRKLNVTNRTMLVGALAARNA
jgi:DNA-binding CsgD family transcriptional regulator